jgi:ubiquinone/menaquinone biosynthesis C-methylase UbiE
VARDRNYANAALIGPLRRALSRASQAAAWPLIALREREGYLARHAPEIQSGTTGGHTAVEDYWEEHTVNSTPFATRRASARYLAWRFEEYPLFREFAGLWGEHDGEVVLDYGCGPGNDVVGFLLHTNAKQVIGMDVSRKALELARRRVALHKLRRERLRLIQLNDAEPKIPLPDEAVDYLQCQGVLQHVSAPGQVLRELHRVLKPDRQARVMVYNHDSVWLHLYTSYVVMLLEGRHREMAVEDVFQLTTDGEDCPIARCWRAEEFVALCEQAGFHAEFLGGYLSRHELEMLSRYREQAISDPRLAAEHREFLEGLRFDERGLPMRRGLYAGVGGAYVLRKGAPVEAPGAEREASRLTPAP